MIIKYNPNKKTTFNNYIDTAVTKLKRAETEASCILNFVFSSKTIIGRRFNKKSQISTLKGKINSAYGSLSSVKSDVQGQVDKYVRANNRSLKEMKFLSLTGMPFESYFGEMLLRKGYDYNYNDILEMYDFFREYRNADDSPDKQKKAWEYYDLVNKILVEYSGIFSSEIILNEKNPLDSEYKQILDTQEDMLAFIGYMENTYTDSSQCQGICWLGNNMMAICDIDGKLDKGVIRIIKLNPNDSDKTVEIISEIPVDGHSNDIEYIPEKNIILHPNHRTGEIESIYLNKNFEEKERTIARNKHANGIAKDQEREEIITSEDINVETYSYDKFFSGGTPNCKCLIPDAIKDEENGIYYNLRGGTTAKDGKVYVSYTGYDKDKRSYDAYGDPPDIPVGTMTVIYDEKTGKCEGRIINDSNGEVESIAFNDDGQQVWVMNCENTTYILQSKNNNRDEQVLMAKANAENEMNSKMVKGKSNNKTVKTKK